MLVDIGNHRAFYIETEHILDMQDYVGRPGCYVSMTGGRGFSSSQSARTIMRKIEEAKEKARVTAQAPR